MDVKIDMLELTKTANKVVNRGEVYKQKIETIYKNIDKLNQTWEGTDSKEFVAKVNSYKETLRKLGDILIRQGEFLKKVSKDYQNAQDAIRNAAKKI